MGKTVAGKGNDLDRATDSLVSKHTFDRIAENGYFG